MGMGGVDRPCPWSLRRPMPGRRNASVKDPELYEELRDDGASKQKAARISNAAAKQALDRRPVASRGIQAPVAAARVAAQAAAAAAGRPVQTMGPPPGEVKSRLVGYLVKLEVDVDRGGPAQFSPLGAGPAASRR